MTESNAPMLLATAEQRTANLQKAIDRYIASDYRVINQTEFSAQLVKPKSIHPLLAAFLLLFVGFGWVILLVYYLTLKDANVHLRVDETGHVYDSKSERQHLREYESREASDAVGAVMPFIVPAVTSSYARIVAGAGAGVLLLGGLLIWPMAEGAVTAFVFGGLLLLGVCFLPAQPGESYSGVLSAVMLFVSIFYIAIALGTESPGAWVGAAGGVTASFGCWLKAPGSEAS